MKDVTGRDRLIIAKALVYAIAAIDRVPDEQREWSDRCDMVKLLFTLVPDPMQREVMARAVESHTGTLPDLTDWKAGPGGA